MIQHKKKLFVIIGAIIIGVLFINLKYVCESPQRLRTILFFSYCFFLSAPCMYLILKVLFPKVLHRLFFTFYLFLALFPYKLFFPATADLCMIYTDSSLKLIFGLDRYWVLVLYGIVSLIITVCWLWYHDKQWLRNIPQKEVIICGLLLVITAVQIIPRLGENSPRMVVRGVHKNKDLCDTGNCSVDFFGFCVMCDVLHWVVPNGFFKGVEPEPFRLNKWSLHFLRDEGISEETVEDLKSLKNQGFATQDKFLAAIEMQIGKNQTVEYQEKILKSAIEYGSIYYLVANRRALNAYFYSLIEPFVHPYYAAILLNGLFFYLLLMAGYRFAKYLNLPNTIVLVYPILLSAQRVLLFETIDTSFYTPKYAFSIFILVFGYKLQIFSRSASFTNKFLFCTVLACSSLVYDPYLNVSFVFLWGLFYAISQIKIERNRGVLIFLSAIGFALVPLVSQYGLETLLRHYGLEGVGHSMERSMIFARLPLLPGYFIHNFIEAFLKVNREVARIIFSNPSSEEVEYLKILGIFGVICFFSVVPKYINGNKLKGIYAMYLSNIIIPLIASLVATIPPATGWDEYTMPRRAVNDIPVLLLAQSIGLYHLAKFGCQWLPAWIKPKYVTYLVVLFIFVFSYHKIIFK